MNGPTVKALLFDAFYQVLDNKIFRLLLILEIGIVAGFFLVGFRETEIRVLWGAWTLSYEDVYSFFGQKLSPGSDLQGMLVQRVQSLVVETLSGSMSSSAMSTLSPTSLMICSTRGNSSRSPLRSRSARTCVTFGGAIGFAPEAFANGSSWKGTP